VTWNNMLELAQQLAGRVDWPATGAVVALVLLAVLVLRRTRRKPDADAGQVKHTTNPRVDHAIVMLIGAVVTGTLAQAMWGFFEHKLGISDPWLLVPLFAVLELSLLLCVRSARRMLRWTLEHDPANASAGPAGKVLVFLVSFMALVASSDAHNVGAVMFRLGMPVLALMLLLLEMWEERYQARVLAGLSGPTGLKRFLPPWLLVLLGRTELEVSGLQLVRYTRRVARVCRRLDYLTDRVTGGDKLGRITGWIIRGRAWRLRGKLDRLMERAPEGVTVEAVQARNSVVFAMERSGGRAGIAAAEARAIAAGAASHAPGPVSHDGGPRAITGEPLAHPDGPLAHGGSGAVAREPFPVARPGHDDGPAVQPDGPAVPVVVPVARAEQHPAAVEPLPVSQWPAPVGPRATPDGPVAQPVGHVAQPVGPVARPGVEPASVPAVRLEWRRSEQQPVDVPADTAPLVDGPEGSGGALPVSPELGPIGYVGTVLDRGHRPACVNGAHAPELNGVGRVAVLDNPVGHGAGHPVSQPGQPDGPRATVGEPVAHPDGPAAHSGPQDMAREPQTVAHPGPDDGSVGHADGSVARPDGSGGPEQAAGGPLPAVTVERAGEARAILHADSGEWATAISRPLPEGEQRLVVWLDGSAPGRELGLEELAEFARTLYRASTSPDWDRRLSDRALAELCGVSRRWAGARISEVTADAEQQPGAAASIPQQGGGQPA
jgi:hypothetical protein